MPDTPTPEMPIPTHDETEAHFIALQEILLGTHALATKFVAEMPSPTGQSSRQRAENYLERLAVLMDKVFETQPSPIRNEGRTYAAVNTTRLHSIIKDTWPERVQ
ncbi:hypothetical protein [Microvirga sesbaniae]|uniref:hypothetical protein n=1 Tax=Microvirga sesbaniae TaxID=681392 RepID=UPI0021C948E9|nr:hypothetical protein [Microvirga sp. HBU67692]